MVNKTLKWVGPWQPCLASSLLSFTLAHSALDMRTVKPAGFCPASDIWGWASFCPDLHKIIFYPIFFPQEKPSSNCLLILRSWLRTYHCHDEASHLFSVPSEQFAFCNFSFICVLACLSAYPLRTMIMSVSFPSAPLEPCTQRTFNRCL